LKRQDGNIGVGVEGDAHHGRPDSHIETGGRSRFRRRAERVDLTLLNQLIGHDLIPVLAPLRHRSRVRLSTSTPTPSPVRSRRA